jgi:SSS family solute:Na+ symporter
VASAVLFPYYIRNRIYTIPEFLELRYNRAARVFFSVLMLIICIMTKMAFHLYAGALVLHGLLGWGVMPAISIYLVMPITPAIFFGILSKRVTVQGAIASVLAGSVLAAVFVSDQLIGAPTGSHVFPWLHRDLTLNYTYRGLWGTVAATITLFAVSAFTKPRQLRDLENLTVDWKAPGEAFRGIFDWRLQLAILAIATIALYAWVW